MPDNDDVAQMTFEKALADLEGIVNRLERGEVPLAESIAIYERGDALRKHCSRLLAEAEARVERIRLNADGKPVGTAPLDPE
jgi:exodeoxyribonuclease VII small subunit